MSFFDSLFSSNAPDLPGFWKKLECEEELETAIEKSVEKPIVIFKHSTRCIISKTVIKNFEKEVEASADLPLEFYYLDLLNHRGLSNKIAEDLQVTHQSPQVILIQNKKAVYHTSHDNISLQLVTENLSQ